MNNSSIELSGNITKLILQNNNNKPNSVFTGIALTSIEFTPGNNYVRDSYFYNSTFIYPYPSSTNIYYSNCEFSTNTAFTVANKGEFTDCVFSGGASLVLAVPLIRIIGGESSVPIQITGNNVSISNIIAPSISLGAVTGCNIVNNYVDTTMTIVPGNNFSNNIEY
jgi:hypothetical protein